MNKKTKGGYIASFICSVCYRPIEFAGKKPDVCGRTNCLKRYWGFKDDSAEKI